MKAQISRAILLTVLLLTFTGCRDATTKPGPQPQTGLRIVQTQLGSHKFDLEVADTDHTREIGMMYRDSNPEDHGMIFVFDDEQDRQFYMANTRIPLDIAFLDAGGIIVSIKQMQPLDLRTTGSEKPAKYAIELSEGAAEKVGMKVGDRVAIPAGAMNPSR